MDGADVKAASDALVAALRKATLDSCAIETVTIKDPAQDGHGYDPTKVRTIPYNLAGQKVVAGGHGEPKQIVVRLAAAANSGRSGHVNLRMALLQSEIVAGGDGNPLAGAEPSGIEDTITALDGMIAGGSEFHIYSKTKSGTIRDRAVTAFSYAGVSFRNTRRKSSKRGVGHKPQNWASDVVSIIKDVIAAAGTYSVAKTVVPALASGGIESGVAALGAGASDLLPLLAVL